VHGVIEAQAWRRPALFTWLQEAGEVPEEDLWNTFNLGVGFCLVLPADSLDGALSLCGELGFLAWELGHVAVGEAGERPLAGLPY
jgi:phosphoribosylformylglycinamidine cyclo-ligase